MNVHALSTRIYTHAPHLSFMLMLISIRSPVVSSLFFKFFFLLFSFSRGDETIMVAWVRMSLSA
jgi:hypothetical protein